MFTDIMKIKMLQAAVSGIMKQDEIVMISESDILLSRWYLRFFAAQLVMAFFFTFCVKNFAEIDTH